jgi:hypothetical protein
MTTAAIITVAVGAGSAVGGAAIAAHGQSKAAETQANAAKAASTDQLTAAQQALAFQKEQYANTQKAVAPYQQMGAGALAALGSGLGVTPNMSIGLQPTQSGPHTVTNQPVTYDTLNGQSVSTNYTGDVLGNPNGQTISGVLPSGANSSASLSQSGVRMQSPDGQETGIVAPNKVQYYLQQGAKVIQ